MNILVTGATGFIGQALVNELLALGHSVYALARPASDRRLLDARHVPVIIAALVGELTGHDAYASVKRIPLFASLSIFGVSVFLLP